MHLFFTKISLRLFSNKISKEVENLFCALQNISKISLKMIVCKENADHNKHLEFPTSKHTQAYTSAPRELDYLFLSP